MLAYLLDVCHCSILSILLVDICPRAYLLLRFVLIEVCLEMTLIIFFFMFFYLVGSVSEGIHNEI